MLVHVDPWGAYVSDASVNQWTVRGGAVYCRTQVLSNNQLLCSISLSALQYFSVYFVIFLQCKPLDGRLEDVYCWTFVPTWYYQVLSNNKLKGMDENVYASCHHQSNVSIKQAPALLLKKQFSIQCRSDS